ncbi:MAG: EamA family transporter [Dongiaceae bacterium]
MQSSVMQFGLQQAAAPDPQAAGALAQTRLAAGLGRMPPTALLLLSILAVQLGSALATILFANLGPAGTTLLSTGFSAAVLTAASPPRLDSRLRQYAWLILLFGFVDTCMALPFFLALQYIPLGIASTIAFLGPLLLAVVMTRRPVHFLCIGVALLGIGLLTPEIGSHLDALGLGLAGLSALAWAAFVPLAKQVGRRFQGIDGLTFAMWAASAMLLPVALAEGTMLGAHLLDLTGVFAVALLTVVLPMAMEFQALRRMSARSYGILLTLEPACGALVGGIFLGQGLGPRMMIAIAFVTLAALGITLTDRQDES